MKNWAFFENKVVRCTLLKKKKIQAAHLMMGWERRGEEEGMGWGQKMGGGQ